MSAKGKRIAVTRFLIQPIEDDAKKYSIHETKCKISTKTSFHVGEVSYPVLKGLDEALNKNML